MKKIQNRNKSLKTNASRRLASYLSAGVFVAATEARADIVVTRYSSPDDYPPGISVSGGFLDSTASSSSIFAEHHDFGLVRRFTRGDDHPSGGFISSSPSGGYRSFSPGFVILAYGADPSSSNYVSIDFDGIEGYEAVGQFDFSTPGSGSLVALARDSAGAPLSISAGKTAIDGAAVPEPSGLLLGLLALGAAGCRRRRNAVPPRQVS